MEFADTVRQRRSVKHYDADAKIDDQTLKEIFEEVRTTPSSFNLQHWTFIVVRDPEIRRQLRESAWDQAQVTDAAAVVVACGRLDAHRNAAMIWDDTPLEIKETIVPMIGKFYDGMEELCRDEAIRSVSLAAMTLMLSAKNRGYETCPMIGFNPRAVSEIVKLSSNVIPVMMIVVGKQSQEPRPRGHRYPLSEIVRLDSLDGPGLS